MGELIKTGSELPTESPETYEESLSRQFYEWERRGRGWQVCHYAVDLEPPFRPFVFFEPPKEPITDDGRIPGFFSRLFGENGNSSASLIRRQEHSTEAAHRGHLAELDEPEFCSYLAEEFNEIRVVLPSEHAAGTISKAVTEQLLLSLAFASYPVGFDVIGTSEKIVVQFAATHDDLPQLEQQLAAHLSAFTLTKNQDNDYLTNTWINSGESRVIVDFGLSEEFMLPLNTTKNFEPDPLMAVIGAMEHLQDEETAVFQILFQKAQHDWPQEIINTLRIFEGTDFFSHVPDMMLLAKSKLNSPLFSTVVRVGARSTSDSRAWQIARNIGGALASLSRPSANELIPLSNDGYDHDDHERALLDRQSHRCGMLLNVEELVSLVHPPSKAISSERLERENGRTKPAPKTAIGNPLLIGVNRYPEKSVNASLSDEQRTRHIHVIGSSGSGKTTLLLNLIRQDMERGQGLCVIDPHGDLIDDILASVPESRMNDVILFDPSDAEHPIAFNILNTHTEYEKTMLSSDMIAAFRSMSTSWGDVMDTVLANAILTVIEHPEGGTLLDLKRLLSDKAFRDTFLKHVDDQGIRHFWQHEYPMISGKPQGSILVRLDAFLRQNLIRNIVCQKDTRLNFREVMDSSKILLVKLSQGLIGAENSYLLGTLLVSKLYQAALGRQSSTHRPYFWLYLDEFQHFITPSMEGILSGARKYNLGLTLSHQEFRQLQSRNAETASSVLSNCYTRICFRLGDADSEKFAGGFSHFEARSLQNLGIGEAIARVERSEFDFNLSIPLPRRVDIKEAEHKKIKIIESTRSKYATPKDLVEAELFVDSHLGPSKADDRGTESGDQKHSPIDDSKIRQENQPIPKKEQNQHRYLQSLVKRIGESYGFISVIEKEVFRGLGKIDVALENEDAKIACEVAITNTIDYELQNIQKCLSGGFDAVVVISPYPNHLRKIRKKAISILNVNQIQKLRFLEPESFHLFLESIIKTKDQSTADITQINKVKGFAVRTGLNGVSKSRTSTRIQNIKNILSGAFKRKGNKDD